MFSGPSFARWVKIRSEVGSIFGKYLPYLEMWPISACPKKITQSVLRQIKIAWVVLFAFTKETFLPKELKKGGNLDHEFQLYKGSGV